MLTPAQRHRQMHEAMEQASKTAREPDMTGTERILHRFRQDKKRLTEIQSNARKADLKRRLLPDYQGWVAGVLAADTGRPDEVFVACTIWTIDVGQIETALPLIEYVLRHRLPLPDHFGRTLAAFMVEEICNPALTAIKLDAAARPLSAHILLRLEGMTQAEDMPDPVRAKLYKLLGLTLRHGGDAAQQQAALDYLLRAMTLNAGAGVKREIDTLRRALARRANTEGAEHPEQKTDEALHAAGR